MRVFLLSILLVLISSGCHKVDTIPISTAINEVLKMDHVLGVTERDQSTLVFYVDRVMSAGPLCEKLSRSKKEVDVILVSVDGNFGGGFSEIDRCRTY